MGRWHQAEPLKAQALLKPKPVKETQNRLKPKSFKTKASERNPEPLEEGNDETTALGSLMYLQVSCRNIAISRFT
jgi:hypothetical protein